MTKQTILAELKKLMGKDFNQEWLEKRTEAQLADTLTHYRFYAIPDSDKRIKRLVRANCDVSFIGAKK